MVERFQGLKATVYNLRFQLRAAGGVVTSVQRQLQFAWIVVLRFFDPWLLLGKVWDTTFLLSLISLVGWGFDTYCTYYSY